MMSIETMCRVKSASWSQQVRLVEAAMLPSKSVTAPTLELQKHLRDLGSEGAGRSTKSREIKDIVQTKLGANLHMGGETRTKAESTSGKDNISRCAPIPRAPI